MKTLRKKIKEEERRLKKLLDTYPFSTAAHGHILGEIDGLQKTLKWLDEEYRSFEQEANRMNDEASGNEYREHVLNPNHLYDTTGYKDHPSYADGEIITGFIPYQLCPKCDGGKKIKGGDVVIIDGFTFYDPCREIVCDICNGEGIIPMKKE